jgi:hypothetical protein
MTPGEAPPARSAAAHAPASRTKDAPEARSLIVSLPWPSSDGSRRDRWPRRRGAWSVTPLRSQRRCGAVLVIGDGRQAVRRPRGPGERAPGHAPGPPFPPTHARAPGGRPRRPPHGWSDRARCRTGRADGPPSHCANGDFNEARSQVLQSRSAHTGAGMCNRRVRRDCSPRGCRRPRGECDVRGLWSYRRMTIFPSARRSASIVIPSGASLKLSSAPMSGSIRPSRWRSTSCSWMSGTTWGSSRR